MASLSQVPFKILVLDEADNMTNDAQAALRRTMEKYTETCRFILCCNYSGRIIEPIQSRCALFRFTPLPESKIVEHLHNIAQQEGLKVTESALKSVVEVAEGDLRKGINTLQAAASMSKGITEEAVYQVVGRAKPTDVHEMLTHAMKGDFIKARGTSTTTSQVRIIGIRDSPTDSLGDLPASCSREAEDQPYRSSRGDRLSTRSRWRRRDPAKRVAGETRVGCVVLGHLPCQ